MKKYAILGKQGEGTFSKVLCAICKETNKHVAIKCMKQRFHTIEETKNFKELSTLKLLKNKKYIINLLDVLYDKRTGRLALVLSFMEMNLYELIQNAIKPLKKTVLSKILNQILKALKYIHSCGIFHRDIKPENILINNENKKFDVKIADFGSAQSSLQPAPLTEYISTRWYRAPECLLTDGKFLVFFLSFRLLWATDGHVGNRMCHV